MKLIPLLAAAALIAVPLSGAPAQTQEPAKAAAKSKSSGSERICKRWMKTGSRISPTRTCKTRAEWDDETFAMRSIINQTQANKRVIEGQLNRDAFRACVRC